MVFQHVAYEPLGTLDPLIRSQKHRIRYVNFGREPSAQPNLEGYDALIILGGPMNIGQERDYPHLNTEKEVIREAIDKGIAILGICLGAQLIASAMGAKVYKAKQAEIGWYPLNATKLGSEDPLIKAFKVNEPIFQWHGFTFDLPDKAELLVMGDGVRNQAFRIKNNVYGFQFHLEASEPLIKRWLHLPAHKKELGLDKQPNRIEHIWQQTQSVIGRSLELSEHVFGEFLALLPAVTERHHFPHR